MAGRSPPISGRIYRWFCAGKAEHCNRPQVSCRYTAGNGNFVLVSGLKGRFQTVGPEERIQIIAEAVKGATLFFRQYTIAADWCQQPCREGHIGFLEQLEEGDADRVLLPPGPGRQQCEDLEVCVRHTWELLRTL